MLHLAGQLLIRYITTLRQCQSMFYSRSCPVMIPNNSTASATNPTDTGPDPLHLIVTLQKTMSQISHITATLKNDSNSLTDRYSCAEHVPPPPNVTTKQNTVGSTQTDTIIGLRHKQLKPPRANSTPTDPSHTQVSFL